MLDDVTPLRANWPAPPHVCALTTARGIGHSLPPYDQNNLAQHVGDHEARVLANRLSLKKALLLPKEPIWLDQTHSTTCVVVENEDTRHADAAITRCKENPLAILTADCLPIVLCDKEGTEIAAVHAGWRGLAYGIVENTLAKMQSHPNTLMAWIGPSICQACYEVGDELFNTFTKRYPTTQNTFTKQGSSIHANLPKMAELILKGEGVSEVYQSGACSYELKHQFYSYRREAQTGRMATLIWFKD
ncbi:MAG: peptidoglycan editing factor PgeF [Legionellales bacterium]|nr:peptidoglycan editing factor PgeF [Legionellales bacterium]